MRIGIDVGGTFTDFLLTATNSGDGGGSGTDSSGPDTPATAARVYKVPSTPADPAEGVMAGLAEMAADWADLGQAEGLAVAADRGEPLAEFLGRVSTIVHGTTVTTNGVLTRSGARTGLLTTKGVRDALQMRRGIREEQYNNRYTNVEPLVPRYLRWPVGGRLDYAGAELEPLDEEAIKAGLKLFQAEGVEAVAVCYMNSFADPAHEERTAELVSAALPEAYLTVSARFLPMVRFYDRLSTTVLNSYVGPLLHNYLNSLVARLARAGFRGVLLIMASNGGVISPEIAIQQPAATLLSGPAAGPVMGLHHVGLHGYSDCLTVDMGGTSFDAALVRGGQPLVTTEGEVDRLRLALPMLGIHTIGAGGGSQGWIDEGGLLRMGPQSSGADPGPVCYHKGGTVPTCTDADLLLGYLDPAYFAGGRLKLDLKGARKAIKEQIGDPLGLDELEAAAGMYRLINVNMAAGVREVTVKKGHDPRDFPLVVAGGAGPLHGCAIGAELEIPLLVVPRDSSIFCAAGMLMSDLSHDFVRTYSVTFDRLDQGRLRELFEAMAAEGRALLRQENIAGKQVELHPSLELRYLKQYHEVNVPAEMDQLLAGDLEAVAEAFHAEHDRLYGYNLKEEGTPMQLINCRLRATGRTAKPVFAGQPRTDPDPAAALKGERPTWLDSARTMARVPVYDGQALRHGHQLTGPALVEQPHTTLFVTPEYRLFVDAYGSFVVYLKEKEGQLRGRLGL